MRRRASARGAAMVEAAVIIPVIVVFFGVMAHIYAKTKAALASQHDARVAVMYYATNDCAKHVSSEDTLTDEGGQLPTPPNTGHRGLGASDAAAGGPGAFDAHASWSFAESSARKSATVYGRTENASSKSWAVCNESPQNGNLQGLLGYTTGLFNVRLP